MHIIRLSYADSFYKYKTDSLSAKNTFLTFSNNNQTTIYGLSQDTSLEIITVDIHDGKSIIEISDP